LTKILLICSASCFNLGGLGALFKVLSPPKSTHGDGTNTKDVDTVLQLVA